MNQLKNFFIGILIGTGLILPGVSGAVLAISFGVYDQLIESAANFFTNVKKYTLFLLPFLIGIFFGAFLFGNIILYLFDSYEAITKSIFLGLIIGSIPTLIDKVKIKNISHFKVNYFFLALFFGLLLFFLDKSISLTNTIQNDISFIFYLKMFFAGFVYSIGKIIPGISSSFMLMILGFYTYIINLIAHPFSALINEPIAIIMFVLGFLFGIVMLSKVILHFVRKHSYESYSAIIGFIIGSVLILVPNYEWSIQIIYSILGFSFSFCISYLFSIGEIKKKS